MSLIELATWLLKIAFCGFLIIWVGCAAFAAVYEFVKEIRYPFLALRRSLGAEEPLAPTHHIVVAMLASKACAAGIAIGIALLLGGTREAMLIAAALAAIFLG